MAIVHREYFKQKDGKIIMSLSGNPGAAVDGLLKIGLPCIRKLCGYEKVMPRTMELFMEKDFRKTSDRLRLVRGKRVFRDGKVCCIVNCMVLTEGFDAPRTDAVLVVRPTCNSTLYQQIVGRGLRS